MNPSITNRGLLKARFFAIYIVSVLLIVLLLSSFLLPENSASEHDASSLMISDRAAIIERLHRRMAPLQLAAVAISENGAAADAWQNLEKEKAMFMSVIDSIHKKTAVISNEKDKAGIEKLLQSFALDAERWHQLAKGYSSFKRSSSAIASGKTGGAELEQLKAMLVQKDVRIGELEQQKQLAENEKNTALAALQNNTASTPNLVTPRKDQDAAEWKDKYNKLKAASEKSAAQLDAMKTSYREAIEDNRRLLSQLQSVRAEKNNR